MKKKHFFIPYRGNLYKEGINDKRVLILGASFGCDKTECAYFRACTDRRRKDSSEFDLTCPEYAGTRAALHNEPTYCVEEQPRAYRLFGANVAYVLGISQDEFWQRVAFTNYVQFFLPAEAGYADTRVTDLSQRDFDAFLEVVRELKPHVIVIWGCITNSTLKEDNPYLVRRSELYETEWYVCHIRIPGVEHEIAICNPYHPSSPAWFSTRDKFDKYLLQILNTNDDENK